jgi:hypothetical protein
MNLADAVHLLAISGCRIVPAPAGGVELDVPEGAVVPAEVLAVLRAHRDQLAATVAPAAPAMAEDRAEDLVDYLTSREITGASAELVLHAARTFNVRSQAITVEREDGEEAPAFFEPGITFLTTIDTEWHEPGRGHYTIPAGTLGLAIPQTWAIADAFDRNGIEAIQASIKKRNLPRHTPVWLQGRARVIEINLITFDNATAPPGMNLMPWRSKPSKES